MGINDENRLIVRNEPIEVHTRLRVYFFFVGGLVSHNDFHGGASSSNLRDGHNLHSHIHVRTCVRYMGPNAINCGMST